MKNKTGIISALALSLAIAGSAFAGVKTQDSGTSGSAATPKMQNTATMNGKKTKSKKHHTAKHAKTMKYAKTSKSRKRTMSPTKK